MGDYLKQCLIKPINEMTLHKSIVIEDIDYHFLSIIEDEKNTNLWVLVHDPNLRDTDHEMISPNTILNPGAYSKRDKELAKFMRADSKILSFRHIYINEQPYISHSSSGHHIIDLGFEEGLFFQHFSEIGLIPDRFYDYNIKNLSYYEYKLLEGEAKPLINPEDPINIRVETGISHSKHWVDKSVNLTLDENLESKVDINLDDGTTCLCYFHGLSLYDIHEEMAKPLPRGKLSHLSDDEMVSFQIQRIQAAEDICPKGHKLLVVNYELQEGYQLQLSSIVEFPSVRSQNAPSSSAIIMLKPEEKTGPNGLVNRCTHIATVADDFDQNVDVTIWTILKNIPPQNYKTE